jgi:quercetin dioxygenase-like cupin family protein
MFLSPEIIGLRTNPSEEVIRLGALTVRFLITGEDSKGSIAAFEIGVSAADGLASPAHSHDHYEETIFGIEGVLTWTVNRQ